MNVGRFGRVFEVSNGRVALSAQEDEARVCIVEWKLNAIRRIEFFHRQRRTEIILNVESQA